MKKFIALAFISFLLFSCNNSEQTDSATEVGTTELEYFGEEITTEGSILAKDFFTSFAAEDSTRMKLEGEITSVCQKKGCWMKMGVGENDEEIFVKFKDYGFFVPLNCEGRTAIMEGWAYKDEQSVEELKHYAFDAGKSQEEIDAITEPEVTYTFLADGVVLK